jgi:beta-mannanase
VSLDAIAAGKYDGYLRAYAGAVKSFGAPVALSFGHEMNGWWYPWSLRPDSPAALYRAKPAAFISAWRHIHDVFARVGAKNVTWVWTVRQNAKFASHPGFPGISAWWPGGKYVDWVGMDGYFRRANENFASVFGTQVTDIRALTNKPILISETAVRMSNPDAVTQINELFTGVRDTPGLLGLIWFDLDAKKTGIRWNIDRNRVALTAIHKAIHAPAPPAR